MENKTFSYRKYQVRFSKKGWSYNSSLYPFAMKDSKGIEVYFHTKEEAKEYIDKLCGDNYQSKAHQTY